MNVLNNFFDKVFLISIDRNKNRVVNIADRLAGLQFEVFEGIDGRCFYPQYTYTSQFPENFFIENNLDPGRAKSWSRGQLGCAMSHRLVHRKIADEKISSALILEDDAVIDTGRLRCFSYALKELPVSWELLYVGYREVSPFFQHRNVRFLRYYYPLFKKVTLEGCKNDQKGKRFYPEKYSKHLDYPGVYFGSHAYGVSLKGAEKLLEIDSPLLYGADSLLMNACYHKKIKAFSLYQKIFFPAAEFETTVIN